jgi:hypothetical protein
MGAVLPGTIDSEKVIGAVPIGEMAGRKTVGISANCFEKREL